MSGWMDWFIPQIYWAIEPPQQSYPLVLEWWLDVSANNSGKIVLAGNAVYKMTSPWEWEPQEIIDQVEISRQDEFRQKMSLGNVHFSAKYFRDGTKNVTEEIKKIYKQDASIPTRGSNL
jgi:uncharacterized lipoprotein YddW (UPF0748 family)